ncbi:MAG TPA: substrate-binding domain-containing protein [Lacunisphaera sp.]|nr:substrate-binding domain-containing protein [Lacunisphaera sp.]
MRRVLLAILCAISAGFSLTGIAAETRKVGLLLKGRTNFWSTVEQGAKAAAAESGVELIVKAPPTESDIAIQIQLFNALAAQKVDCLIVAPASAEALAIPAASLAVTGVKIIVLDSPLNGKTASVFIGTDHEAAGAAAGRLLAGLVSDNDTVSVLRHAQGNLVTAAREDNAIATLKAAHANVAVFSDIFLGNAKEEQMDRAKLMLSKHPEAKAMLASSTPGTTVLMQLLAESPKPGAIKLVGFGYNLNESVATALEKGTLHGWIAQLPLEMGRLAVKNAVAVLDGQTPPAVVHTDFRVITKENLHEPEVQALLKL